MSFCRSFIRSFVAMAFSAGFFAAVAPSPQTLADDAASSDIPDRREFPVDTAVKPCADFYAYACDKVVATFKLRDDRSAHTFAFNDSSERLLKAKEKFFTDLAAADDAKASPRRKAMRNYFKACMNEAAGAKDEPAYVAEVLKEVGAIKDAVAFRGFISRQIVSDDFGFFDFGAAADHDNPDQYDLYLAADLESLPERSYYANADVVKDLEGVMTSFFATIGMDHPAERAQRVIAFEKEFSQTYPLPTEFRDVFSSKTGITRAELAKRYPNLPLAAFLKRIPDGTHIRDLMPKNFAWLNGALAPKASAGVETLKDLYIWHALASALDDGYPKFFDEYFKFRNKHLGGPEKRSPRGERCTHTVMERFGRELDQELVDQIFPGFPSDRVVAMAERVRGAIVAGLATNTWLKPETRKIAANKMQVARLQLVKPATDEEWDFNLPADYTPDHPVQNDRLWQLKHLEKTLARFASPRNQNLWGMGPLTVNAYYSPSDNKFVLPIGILQYPFYDPKASEEENLGAIGAVIGHELGHGIDDKGAKFDASGRLNPWMGDDDLKEFKRRSARLVDQFDKAGHNGTLTLGENIGDLVGLTFAYRAAFPEGRGTLAQKRAFFTQFGRAWCNVMRPKFKELKLKTDPHAQGEARVNQQMKHQPGFAEAFECKPGDALYLNPEDRVVIW